MSSPSSTSEVKVEPGFIVDAMKQAGFHWPEDIILGFLSGSHHHGARLEGKSDLDMAGIYIEPPHKLLGLDIEEHFTHATADNSRRNTADDEDFKLYSLRHWARLAAKGNPTILSFLFVPDTILDRNACWTASWEDGIWCQDILRHRNVFLASSHAAAFLGYGQSQYHRMVGARGLGKHGQRPELETEFGYDTKAAMHMIRLMYEGLELLRTGRMTFPRPEKDLLLQIRQGAFSQQQIEQKYLQLEREVKEAEATSPLPKRVDRGQVSRVITDAYVRHWKQRGYL